MNFTGFEKKKINIAVFNGSSPIISEKMENSINYIKKISSFNLLSDKSDINTMDAYFQYLARAPEMSAKKFIELLFDNEIDIIWCARGGYGILKWLQYIHWDKIKDNAKIPLIIGFSDVTFLHSCLSKANKVSLHAPLFTSLPTSSDETLNSLLITLGGKPQTLKGHSFKEGLTTGKLIGGNLTCLIHSIGTHFEPNWDEAILLLEDHNEAPYKIDRMLTHLLLSGRLEKIKGICLGEFFYNSKKIDVEKILKITWDKINMPVLFDLPFGHGKNNFALLIGSEYKIDAFKGILEPVY